MSPEQARGQQVDARTDVWSLAVVLYEMVAGRSPFDGPNRSDVLAAILDRDPAPIARFAPDVPHELQRIVTKALRKDRVQRYQTMQDLLIDLTTLRDELQVQSASAGAGQHDPAPNASSGAGQVSYPRTANALVAQARARRHRGWSALAATIVASWRAGRATDVRTTEDANGDRGAAVPEPERRPDVDFLRFGLADEVAGILSPVTSLAVRPSTMTRRYAASDFDLQAAGRELRVPHW